MKFAMTIPLLFVSLQALHAQTVLRFDIQTRDGKGWVTPYADKEMTSPMANPMYTGGQERIVFWVPGNAKVTVEPIHIHLNAVVMPKPAPKPHPTRLVQVWGLADSYGRVDHPTQPVSVTLPDWNGTRKMFTPTPQVVFMDEPIERIAVRRQGYEKIGFKFYRRVK